MKTIWSACFLFVVLSLQSPLAYGQMEGSPAEVAEQLLEAITNRDTTLFRSVTVPGALIIGTRRMEGEPQHRIRSVDDNIRSLAGEGPAFLERMWEPEVRIDDTIATVWTRYDFYIDDAFSHCGTDAFHLVQTPEGWKITSVIYTTEPDSEKCPESPLGSPK